MNKVKTREIRPKGLDFPTFLYDENTNYEADDIAKGLLRVTFVRDLLTQG